MRWKWGAIPETPGFEPERDERWQPLAEPELERFQSMAMATMGVSLLPLLAMWWAAAEWAGASPWGRSMLWASLCLPLLVAVHEAVHMLAHPGGGRHDHSVLGGVPKQGLFFAMYLGEMSRERLLLVLVAPLFALTLLPWLLCVGFRAYSPFWATISVVNGISACGDILSLWLVWRGTPRGAVVRNQGWKTWWREPSV